MAQVHVSEARGVLERQASADGSVWECVFITEGEGSSTNYTAEMLQSGAAAFPKGTKHWWGHTDWLKDHHDPRDQWGVSVEDAWFDNSDGVAKIKGKVKVFERFRDIIETLVEESSADLSISAAAAVNEETGEIVSIIPSKTNSVDIVDYPGREGSRITRQMFESARNVARDSSKPDTTPVQETGKLRMDEKALEAVVTRLLEAKLAPVVTFVESAKAQKVEDAQAAVDEAALGSARKDAVEAYRAADKLISEAELLEPQVADLRERAANGEDIAKAIESAKAIKEAAVKAATEAAKGDTVLSEGAGANDNWEVDL